MRAGAAGSMRMFEHPDHDACRAARNALPLAGEGRVRARVKGLELRSTWQTASQLVRSHTHLTPSLFRKRERERGCAS
jgi:hypothetical protein